MKSIQLTQGFKSRWTCWLSYDPIWWENRKNSFRILFKSPHATTFYDWLNCLGFRLRSFHNVFFFSFLFFSIQTMPKINNVSVNSFMWYILIIIIEKMKSFINIRSWKSCGTYWYQKYIYSNKCSWQQFKKKKNASIIIIIFHLTFSSKFICCQSPLMFYDDSMNAWIFHIIINNNIIMQNCMAICKTSKWN